MVKEEGICPVFQCMICWTVFSDIAICRFKPGKLSIFWCFFTFSGGHVHATSSGGSSVLQWIGEKVFMSASQVGCKTIGCDIKSVDTRSKGGDSQYSVDGNSLSKISEDLTESCISVLVMQCKDDTYVYWLCLGDSRLHPVCQKNHSLTTIQYGT